MPAGLGTGSWLCSHVAPGEQESSSVARQDGAAAPPSAGFGLFSSLQATVQGQQDK